MGNHMWIQIVYFDAIALFSFHFFFCLEHLASSPSSVCDDLIHVSIYSGVKTMMNKFVGNISSPGHHSPPLTTTYTTYYWSDKMEILFHFPLLARWERETEKKNQKCHAKLPFRNRTRWKDTCISTEYSTFYANNM